MTDHLTPDEVAEADALTGAALADLEAYRARVAELAADRSLTRLAAVWCASCKLDNDRRHPPGVILDSPDGPLLVTREPVDRIRVAEPDAPSRWATPAEWRAEGHPGQIPTRRHAWIVAGPNTYAARFGRWRPPSALEDDIPVIRCARHGTLAPDLDELGTAIRRQWRRAGVNADGRVTPM